MSSTRSLNATNAFAIDAFRISMELCAISAEDAPGVRSAAIRKGLRSYRKLIQMRESLSLTGDDASASEGMLKSIEARLEYLCSVSTLRRNQWRFKRRHETAGPELHIVDIRPPWSKTASVLAVTT
ncbi:MAG TPA: hypothetical protein VJS11_09220 [Acidobacteriaceae bacterium]|nr:hypothetical protein [Acidobacteriaceae bacterium]